MQSHQAVACYEHLTLAKHKALTPFRNLWMVLPFPILRTSFVFRPCAGINLPSIPAKNPTTIRGPKHPDNFF